MSKRKRFSVLLVAAMAMGCGRPLPDLKGIDLRSWKMDKNGCSGARASVVEAIKDQRNKLQGLSEMQVLDLLGRPDQNELYKRNQKFYFYWLEPGKPCGGASEGRKLSVRFNAMGLAKEIAVE